MSRLGTELMPCGFHTEEPEVLLVVTDGELLEDLKGDDRV